MTKPRRKSPATKAKVKRRPRAAQLAAREREMEIRYLERIVMERLDGIEASVAKTGWLRDWLVGKLSLEDMRGVLTAPAAKTIEVLRAADAAVRAEFDLNGAPGAWLFDHCVTCGRDDEQSVHHQAVCKGCGLVFNRCADCGGEDGAREMIAAHARVRHGAGGMGAPMPKAER